MPTRAVKDWLSEYKTLPESDVNTYANAVRNNEDLVDSLYDLFDDSTGHDQEFDPVCHQLFDFYRSGNGELQKFTLEAMPVMFGAYLTALSHNDKKRCSSIEACLLGVYNLEVIGSDGKPKIQTYTIPTLAMPSVYHEPPSLATLALTESALFRYHTEEHATINIGPFPHIERLHSQNRMSTLTHILSVYNADIANLSPRSHYSYCKVASRLVKTGFDSLMNSGTESNNLNDSLSSQSSRESRRGVQFHVEPRIQLSSIFLVELLTGIYFAMFNGQACEGIQAVEDIHQRASYELYADVLLVTNAIKNSLTFNPSGQPKDGPMGISIALSPTQGSPAFLKSAITNASFRTKKLPDDIHPQSPEDEGLKQHLRVNHSSPPSSPLSREEELIITSNLRNFEILQFYEKQMAEEKKARLLQSNEKSVLGHDKSGSSHEDKVKFLRSDSNSSGKKFGSLRGSWKKKKKDIEVPDEEKKSHTQATTFDCPPNYDEVVPSTAAADTEKHKSSGKLPKQLKSIMKKGSSASEKSEKKPHKRDSDLRKDKKLGVTAADAESYNSPKNPKHSISMSTGLGIGLTMCQETEHVDPSMVGVQVIRSSSSSATGRTFQMVDCVELRQGTNSNNHIKRTSSISEDSAGSNPRDVNNSVHDQNDGQMVDDAIDTAL